MFSGTQTPVNRLSTGTAEPEKAGGVDHAASETSAMEVDAPPSNPPPPPPPLVGKVPHKPLLEAKRVLPILGGLTRIGSRRGWVACSAVLRRR